MKEGIMIRKGEAKYERKKNGKLYRMLIKSDQMEAIISELEPFAESRLYKHEGEEIHIILKGKVEYMVGETSYILKKGDVLWHPSDLPHKAKNLEKDKSSYLTIGSPPTFM